MERANTYYLNKHLSEADMEYEFEVLKADLVEDLVAGNDVTGTFGNTEYNITFEEVITHMIDTVHITELAPIMNDFVLHRNTGNRSNELESWVRLSANELVEGAF